MRHENKTPHINLLLYYKTILQEKAKLVHYNTHLNVTNVVPHCWCNDYCTRLGVLQNVCHSPCRVKLETNKVACFYSTKHASCRSKEQILVWSNHEKVFEQDPRTVVSVSQHYYNLIKCLCLVLSEPHHHQNVI